MDKTKDYMFKFDKDKEMWAAVPLDKLERFNSGELLRGEDSQILYSQDISTLIKFING